MLYVTINPYTLLIVVFLQCGALISSQFKHGNQRKETPRMRSNT